MEVGGCCGNSSFAQGPSDQMEAEQPPSGSLSLIDHRGVDVGQLFVRSELPADKWEGTRRRAEGGGQCRDISLDTANRIHG